MKERSTFALRRRCLARDGMLRPATMRALPSSSFALFLVAAACSSNGNRTPALLTPGARIDATNAVDVASAAYRTAFEPLRAARIAASFFDVEPPTPPPTPPATPPTGALTRTLPGPEGGSALFTWHDRDQNGRYSSGDGFTIVFADYGADGRVLRGAAVFTDVRTIGQVPGGFHWTVSAQLELIGLQTTANGVTTSLDGSFRLRREQRATVRLLDLENLAELPFGVRRVRAGSTASRNDYLLDFSMGLFADGSFVDPLLGGLLTYQTEVPMTGIQVLPDPGTGALRVEGASGSALWLLPTDWFSAEIHLDADGDGVVERVIPVAYEEL